MKRIFTFLAIVLFLVLPVQVFSQGGSTAENAVNIFPGTITAQQGRSQYFQYTALQNGIVTISTCNASVFCGISVTTNNGALVDTFETDCNNGYKQVSFAAVGGLSYLIQIVAAGNSALTLNWTLSVQNVQQGQSCQNPLTALLGTNSYSNSGSTPVWYVYTASKDCRVDINTCGYNYPFYIAAYGSCDANDTLECFHNNCTGSPLNRDNAFFYALAGQTYYFCWKNPNGNAPISFNFNLTEEKLSPGELCTTALPLVVGKDSTGGVYLRWFTYSPPANTPQKILINSCGTNTFYSQIHASCTDNNYERSVQHGSCGNATTTQFQAIPGNVYYIKVFPSLNDTFGVYATTPVQGEICSNPFTAVLGSNLASHVNNTDQWYVYTSPVAGTLHLTCPNFGNTQIQFFHECTDNAFVIADSVVQIGINQTIYILLRDRDYVTYNWTLSIDTTQRGTDRNSAIPAVVGSNVLAAPSQNIWYKYTTPVNAVIEMSTCGTASTNTGLQVEDQYGFYLGSNYNACGGSLSDYSVSVEAGQTIYMNWTASGSVVSFNLDTSYIPSGLMPIGYTCGNPILADTGSNASNYNQDQLWQWFTYTAPDSGTLVVSDCASNPSDYTKVYIQSSCGEFGRNTLEVGSSCGSNGSAASYWLPAGQQVYIAWEHTNPATGTLNWNLKFTSDAVIIPGSDCSSPFTAVASNSTNTLNGDAFYTYTAPSEGVLTISSSYTSDMQVNVYPNCGFYDPLEPSNDNPIISSEVGGPDQGVINLTCAAGNTYLIVWKQGYTSNTFTWNTSFTTLSHLADIDSFWFQGQVTSSIDSVNGKIQVIMPFGTDQTELTGYYQSSIGSVVQIGTVVQQDSLTINNYSSPVTYQVTAQDGVTTKNWTVTETNALNSLDGFTAFGIAGQVGSTILDSLNNTIQVVMPYGTDLTALTADYLASYGAVVTVNNIVQKDSVTINDFTNEISYLVTSQNEANSKTWTVLVSDQKNGQDEITSFGISGQVGSTVIDNSNETISIYMPYGTDLTNLVATYTASASSTVKVGSVVQQSGVTANNFTNAVSYVVTAQNGVSNQTWNVVVTNLPNSQAHISAYSLPNQVGKTIINNITDSIKVIMPYGTDLTQLIATFMASAGSSVSVGSTVQQSGITTNDFTNPVSYNVTAQNGADSVWVVKVTEQLNSADSILSFSIPNQISSTIDKKGKTVKVVLLNGSSVGSLIPDFTLSAGASANIGGEAQTSGVSAVDFTSPVVYAVVAANGDSIANWTVSVTFGEAVPVATEQKFSIYPVPTSSLVNISIPEGLEGPWSIQLINEVGQLLLSEKSTQESPIQFNISSYANGTYYLVLSNGTVRQVLKVVLVK